MPIATTGLILRQIKVGEADRILTILTPVWASPPPLPKAHAAEE